MYKITDLSNDSSDVVLDIPIKPKQIADLLAHFSSDLIGFSNPLYVKLKSDSILYGWKILCELRLKHTFYVLRFQSPSYVSIDSCKKWMQFIINYRQAIIDENEIPF